MHSELKLRYGVDSNNAVKTYGIKDEGKISDFIKTVWQL